MADCVVIYQSKYGATKRYAQWLAQELGCECIKKKDATGNQLALFDTIIYGGGIYASGIAGISLLKKHETLLKGKRVLVFAVGASPVDESILSTLRKQQMPAYLQDAPLFYLRGAFDTASMTSTDRFLIKMLQRALEKRSSTELAQWEQALLEAGTQPQDWTAIQAIQPIVSAVKG